jgi:hypothetical protein
MTAKNGRPDHIEDVLVKLHQGQWFGWSDFTDKVYSNLVIHDDQYSKPTKASLESGLVQAQDDFDWQGVRRERDSLLSGSDHILMPDYPLEDKSDWEAYRQELRDIPQDFDDAEDVEWPEQPSG